ncbi:hypothetical protein D9758_001353 [Tetrapyrgos nigripes]|uniref:DNA replication checkpoint mediator MRC1 domain-containing protein n=1 Tax=Tetrapyrgos nigripes TaxID=182062 RepID=A0A8H5GRR4_9AGAR|nr:hypothetical protein D9758_001353 [Tetrapyrgos nigripes]
MPITKEDSIVADSTISSSPPPVTPPKRPQARRTYGRPKPVTDQPVSTTSNFSSSTSGTSNHSIRHFDASDEIPPTPEPEESSPDRTLLDDDSMDTSRFGKDASGGLQWGWMDKMKKLDEEVDMDSPKKSSKAGQSRIDEPDKADSPLSSDQRDSTKLAHITASPATSPISSPSGALSATGIGGTLSALTIHSSPLLQPPIPPRVTHKRPRISDSESEHELDPTSSQSILRTSNNSPKTRSSTPPTSDEEMGKGNGAAPPPKKKRAAKTHSARQSLDFQPESLEEIARPTRKTKPTKKEMKQTQVERQRLLAEEQVSIPKHQDAEKYSMNSFLQTLQKKAVGPANVPQPKVTQPRRTPVKKPSSSTKLVTSQSSPIDSFPSSPGPSTSQHKSPSRSKPGMSTLKPLDDSDSEDLPDIDSVTKQVQAAGKPASIRQSKLAELKQKALGNQQPVPKDDSDSDLEIEVLPPSGKGKTVDKGKSVIRRNTQQQKLNVAHRKPMLANAHGRKSLPAGSVPNTQYLNKMLLERANDQQAELISKKEEEWKRRGGKLEASTDDHSQNVVDAVASWAEKGLETAAQTSGRHDNSDDEEEEDEDYVPIERGSASPEPNELDAGFEEDDEADITMVNEDDENEDSENVVNRRPAARGRAVIDSDEEDAGENDENLVPPPPRQPLGDVSEDWSMSVDENSASRPFLRRGSFSSAYATEEEPDKENIDRGDNKENQAVSLLSLGRPPLGSRQSSRRNLEDSASRLSISPGQRSLSGGDEMDDQENQPVRRPLGPLHTEESFSPSSLPFTARLQRAASLAQNDTLSPTLNSSPKFAPLLAEDSSKLGFSQFSEDGANFSPKPLQAGFSDLFETGTQKSANKDGFKLANAREADDLQLTQDVALQPALEVDENLQRRADAIFEKEQEYVVDAANQRPVRTQGTWYITENGFLTQTRPDTPNPEVYRPAPTPSQLSQTQRLPFTELTLPPTRDDHFVDDLETPLGTQSAKLTRIRRGSRGASSLQLGGSLDDDNFNVTPPPSPSRPSKLKNAFEMLGKKPEKEKDKAKEKQKRPLDKNDFVEDQAQESDEDEMFGFRKNKQEDEEDGEHLDRELAVLVDNKEMTEDVIAADKVMEAYQADVEKDDAELQKYHERATRGELRKKRKNRVGVDDSDDEDEDAENRARRRGMNKWMNRKDRQDIEALHKQPETASFATTYVHTIRDEREEADMDWLNKQSENPMGDIGQPKEEEEDSGGENETDQDEDKNPQTITREEYLRKARIIAKEDPGGELENDFDPNDISFIDQDGEDDDDFGPVKTVLRKTKPIRPTRPVLGRPDMDIESFDGLRSSSSFMHEGHGQERMKKWARDEERKIKNKGMARGAVAVTGHGTKNSKGAQSGVGLGRRGLGSASASTSSASASSSRPSALKAAPSMLKGVDRSERFA